MKKFLQSLHAIVMTILIASATTVQSQSIIGSVLTPPCNNNGQIGVTVTGLTAPVSYTYTNGQTGQIIVHSNINSLSNSLSGVAGYQSVGWANPNIWFVSASDGVNTLHTSIIVTPAFADSIQITPGICPTPSTLEATNFVGGTSPYSVVWANQNTSLTYSTNPALVPDGSYLVTITDAAGCMVTSVAGDSSHINVTSISNMGANISGTAANCINGTAVVTTTAGVSPFTYLWSNSSTAQSISGLSQGFYSCTVTDATGCHSTVHYNLQQAIILNYNATVGNATCFQNNGSVTSFISGGTAPYTFLWNNAATTQNLSSVPGGQYYVEITDANGCRGTGYPYVAASTPVSVTYTASPSSCTSPSGSATITASGGVAPYSIVWILAGGNTTGNSISNKASGTYLFKVTDANGCIQTGSVYIPPVSIITAGIVGNAVVCPATTGNLTVTASSSNGPLTYLWSNSATTNVITNVSTGYYTCVITDAAGCSVTKGSSLIQTSLVNVGFNSTPATCIFSNNGSLTANALGGVSPYTYVWTNSQTGATATSLTTNYYGVLVTDANGCVTYSQTFVGYNAANNSCYCTITGTVYADANINCTRNLGENGIPNVQIHCSGLGYTYTDTNGVYSFLAPTGTYTITETIQQIYPLTSCQTNNQVISVTAATNCTTNVDFSNLITPIQDLHIITTSCNYPIAGNTYTQMVVVQNDGSVTESSAKIGYTHDGQLSYNSCTPWALAQQNSVTYPNWYSIASGFTSLNPGASSVSYITYNVPTNIPLNTVINFNDTVTSGTPIATSWLNDNTPWNNVNSYQTYVIGSYDPNFKEVSPKGIGAQGNITKNDSMLTYVIHFQNTGTYFAQNIILVDSLSSNVDMRTLRPGYSNHNYETTVSETGVVKFNFKNINLAWKSLYGDALSSGMVTYSVKLKRNLAVGTTIRNKAAIYFDYNEPVITNTTLNTIIAATVPTSVRELTGIKNGLSLFPNPASDNFTLMFHGSENCTGVLRVMDISGREVSAKTISLQTGENILVNSAANLQNGIYLVQLKTAKEIATNKLVISK